MPKPKTPAELAEEFEREFAIGIAAGHGTPVPEEVRELLEVAFGEGRVVEGLLTQGHTVQTEGIISTGAGESNLLYGELVPEGVSKALAALGATQAAFSGTLLELGMGTGKMAFQGFLQCPGARQVVGVEISPSRYDVAVAAADRLASARAARFASWAADADCVAAFLPGAAQSEPSCVRAHVLEERSSGRRLWLLEGDVSIVACDGGPIEDTKAILLNVRMPADARRRTFRTLQRAPDGCRVFMLENLTWEWMLPEPSVLHAIGEGVIVGDGTDKFITSWCPKGYPFNLFEVDRQRRPTITDEYAIDAVKNLYASGFF